MDELKICYLYPDMLNLFSDGGNITCMKKRLEWRGMKADVTEIPVGEKLNVELYASDFLPSPEIIGTLIVTLNGKEIYRGEKFILAGGLQRLIKLSVASNKIGVNELKAEFIYDNIMVVNSWTLWVYPEVKLENKAELSIADGKLKNYHLENANENTRVFYDGKEVK